MSQYRNVLSWLETKYLHPAAQITKRAVENANKNEKAPEPSNYAELKDIENLLEEALIYVREHQK
ncbi:MAG: hypothetical protein FWF77_04640 [Defluviitaleaceae bacterium]|nr:hypothetical protein [Defluviitaleaceae bacterium]